MYARGSSWQHLFKEKLENNSGWGAVFRYVQQKFITHIIIFYIFPCLF